MAIAAPRSASPAVASGGLILLAFIFWSPWLVGGNVPVPGDQQSHMLPWSAQDAPIKDPVQWQPWWWDGVAQFYPWRVHLHRSLSAGEWPLWNPSQFCGYPFVGNGQSAIFYPPNWLYAFIHPRIGFALLAFIHTSIALLLTFFLCRVIGLGLAPSALAAIAYGFAGPMIGLVPLPTMTNSAAWLPGCILGIELIARGRRPSGAAWLGASAGLTVLAGHLQIAAYVLLAAAIYAIARTIHAAVSRRPAPAAWLSAGALIALLIASAQLLPSLELGGLSPRGTVQASEAGFQGHTQFALKPIELATLVMPEALGHPARGDYPLFSYGERTGFIGSLTLALAVIALAGGRRWWRWALFAAALVTLWATMGGLPAKLLYFGVPKIGLAGGFIRLLFIYTFMLAILGAIGLQVLQRRAESGASFARHARIAVPVALILLCLELFSWAWRTIPSVPSGRLYPPTDLTRYLQERVDPGDRILAVTPRDTWQLMSRPNALLPPNSATAYGGLESIQGYDSLYPRAFADLAARIEDHGAISPAANGNMMLLESIASPLLHELGVRFIILPTDTPPDPLPEDFRVATVLSRCLVLESTREIIRACATPLESLGAISAWEFDHIPAPCRLTANTVTIDEPLGGLPPSASRSALIIRNTFYPGWRAWLDREPVPVEPFDGALQQIDIARHDPDRAFLAFVPATVTIGMFLTLLGAGTIAGLIGFHLYVRPRRRELSRPQEAALN